MKRAYPFSQLWCQRDRERVAVPLPFVGSDDHTRAIEEFYIFKRGKICPHSSTPVTACASLLEHFFSASCRSFSKVNKPPIKCLQEEMLLMLPSGIC